MATGLGPSLRLFINMYLKDPVNIFLDPSLGAAFPPLVCKSTIVIEASTGETYILGGLPQNPPGTQLSLFKLQDIWWHI
jgi:hypothetical protein